MGNSMRRHRSNNLDRRSLPTKGSRTRLAKRRLFVESLEDRRLLNAGPVAVDDLYEVGESSSLTIGAPGVLSNDTDADGDTLTVSSFDDNATLGIVGVLPNGSFAYTPAGKFDDLIGGATALDTFTYIVSDGKGGIDSATVTIKVWGNDAPNAIADSFSVDEGETLNVDVPGVLLNDTDDPGDVLAVVSVGTLGTVGEVTWNSDGSFSYAQKGKFDQLGVGETDIDSFTYTVSDGLGGSDSAMVTITIHGLNGAPVAGDDTYVANEDEILVVPVGTGLLSNDTDPDFDTLSITAVDKSSLRGSLTVNLTTGSFEYDPNGEFEDLSVGETAIESFSYTVNDGNGGTDLATVTIRVDGRNDAPSATDQSYETDEDTPITVGAPGLLAGAVDVDGDALVVEDVDDSGTAGKVTWNPDGHFTYDPDGAFDLLQLGDSAVDTFTYTISDGHGGVATRTVTWTVSGVANIAPVAADDSGYATVKSKALPVPAPGLIANDTDADGDTLSVISVDRTGTKGVVVVLANGSFAYDPFHKFDHLAAGASATDTFAYTVSDGEGGTDTATVTIVIHGNNEPVAGDDVFAVDEDVLLEVAAPGLLTNDLDPGDAIEVTKVNTSGTIGEVTWNKNGGFSYAQKGAFNHLPVGVTATDSFSYTMSDSSGGTDTASVTITIHGINDVPVASADEYATSEDDSFFLGAPGVLENDTDPDGDELLVDSGEVQGGLGQLLIFPNGAAIYDPLGMFNYLAAGESAVDSFVYTITDSNGGTDTATVSFLLAGVNDAPVAEDDVRTTDEDTPLAYSAATGLLANDVDPDTSDLLHVVGVDTTGTVGKVTFAADGSFTYDPRGKFDFLQNGDSVLDSFTYTISDQSGETTSATVLITVTGLPNGAPVSVNDAASTDRSTPLLITAPGILGNDTDPDDDALSVVSVDNSQTIGLVVWNADGSFAYDPFGRFDDLIQGQSATDTFSYTVSDGEGGFDTAVVTVTVQGNNNPVARNDAYGTHKNSVLQIPAPGLLANDTDPDDALSVVSVDLTETLGKVTWNANGSFEYDPNGQFADLGVGASAVDSFKYTISDGGDKFDTAEVTIVVRGDSLQVTQIVVNDGSAQRSSVVSVNVGFNAVVNLADGAFLLRNLTTLDSVQTAVSANVVGGKSVVTLTFLSGPSVQNRTNGGNSLHDGNYELTILADKVTLAGGVQLDGDGDGLAGGNHLFGENPTDAFFRFFGDSVAPTRLVNQVDFNLFRQAYGKRPVDAAYRWYLDFNGDGIINQLDLNQFRSRYGKRLNF